MFDDARPIFVQLAEQIEDDVLRGVYAEESQVPSTNELAAFLRINPATAGKALNRLVDAGVLYKRRGIGMFVAAGAKALIAAARQHDFAERYVEPLVVEARNLGLGRADVLRLVETATAWQAGDHGIVPLRPGSTADPDTTNSADTTNAVGTATGAAEPAAAATPAATPTDTPSQDPTAQEAAQ
ncbi:GntR family transcriptional regulator [Leucobacter sp. HY1910]